MTSPHHFDLLILGGGSAAYRAAAVAAGADRTVAIVERRAPGGTCPNDGCVPSKLFIETADAYHAARFPRHDAIPGRPDLPFDFARLVAGKDHRILEHREHYIHPAQPQVQLFRGDGKLVAADTVAIDGGPTLTGRAVLIATGGRPVVPASIDGIHDVPFFTSDLLAAAEPGEMRQLPESLLVVGGGYIGLESGQALHRLGSRVTLLVRGGQVLGDDYEPDVRACMGKVLADDGLTVSFKSDLKAVRRDGDGIAADVEVNGKRQTIRAAAIMLATGRRPNTEGLTGVRLTDAGAIEVDAGMATSVPGVWAAGDPVGHQHGAQEATPLANVMGEVAAHNALNLGPRRTVDFRVVPRTIFTEPQVATVGLTEAAARRAGRDVWTGQISMDNVARPSLMHQSAGLCKMVADRTTGEVLGVSLVGPQVGEVIHEAAMGLRFRATVDDFADLVHVFPAVAEGLKIVAVQMRKSR